MRLRPSHTTGHAGPHPAVRSGQTKLVLLGEANQPDFVPVLIAQCVMEWRGFGHAPRPLARTTSPNGPVVADTQLFQPLLSAFACLPLFPSQLPHPPAQMFVQLGHVAFGISQCIVIHPSRHGPPQAVTDFGPATALGTTSERFHFAFHPP